MSIQNLWGRLAGEGNLELLSRLNRIEKREAGYGTVVVPKEGFSDNDDTHNMVLDWLEARGVNVLNIGLSVARVNYRRDKPGGFRREPTPDSGRISAVPFFYGGLRSQSHQSHALIGRIFVVCSQNQQNQHLLYDHKKYI